jgi:ribosome-interacting GTPase 1
VRAIPTIEAELREVERYLREVPPHSGSGQREDLLARAARLRRELAEARTAATDRSG